MLEWDTGPSSHLTTTGLLFGLRTRSDSRGLGPEPNVFFTCSLPLPLSLFSLAQRLRMDRLPANSLANPVRFLVSIYRHRCREFDVKSRCNG